MKEFKYWIAKIFYKINKNNPEVISDYFRKAGMSIGGGCNICCNIMCSEPYLISIGNNVTISGNVTFVTHDNSVCKISKEFANLFGFIKIGDNCFIGQNAILMYGVTLSDNIIVASGSVVCNSFIESNIIVGGNPARKIGTWVGLEEKARAMAMKKKEAVLAVQNKSYEKFVVRSDSNGK